MKKLSFIHNYESELNSYNCKTQSLGGSFTMHDPKADIKLMLGKSIGPYWMIMWKFVSPLTLVVKYKVFVQKLNTTRSMCNVERAPYYIAIETFIDAQICSAY